MRICLVCSHGGHLTEMMELMEAFRGFETFFITYDSKRTRRLANSYLLENFTAKPWTLIVGVTMMLIALLREKPDIIVSTGAEIAIPAFLIARILRIKTIYIESCARVASSSITGRLVYPLSDRFFVQWKQLLDVYGKKARYEGGLI